MSNSGVIDTFPGAKGLALQCCVLSFRKIIETLRKLHREAGNGRHFGTKRRI
jgi:hypothetical protein